MYIFLNKKLYYVTESCYNENSQLNLSNFSISCIVKSVSKGKIIYNFSAPKNFNANLSNSINIQNVRLFDSDMKEVSSCK